MAAAEAAGGRPTRAMVVDDERMNREVLVATLRAAGYDTVTAGDGQDALELMQADPDAIDVVLLDRRMPRMDGMELMARMKADPRLRQIPVIMQTAYASSEDVVEGIKAGVTYYLGKPLDRRLMLSVVAQAVEEHSRFRRLQEDLERRTTALTLMDSGRFQFSTLDEGNTLAVALARSCPNSRFLVVGLSEVFTNAVEHGNLGITFEEKARLVAERRWAAEIEARMASAENRGKRVTVLVERQPGEVRFTVRDQGQGFDWKPYMELDPARAFAAHGRGIAMARRLAFDSMDYRGPGNEVVCVVRDDGDQAGRAECSPAPAPALLPATSLGTPVDEEVRLAQAMQGDLLPTDTELAAMAERYGVRLSGRIETSGMLSGDIWGMRSLDDCRFSLFLADFSGHGLTAALNTFRLHTLMHHMSGWRDRPGQYLGQLNQRLAGLLAVGQYATMLYGVVDVEEGVFTYAAAAAPRPLLVENGAVVAGEGAGLPLGVSKSAAYPERSLPFREGSALFLCSDGLPESPAEDGSTLGPAGMAEMVRQGVARAGADTDVETLLAPFLAKVRRPLRDDLTALCCVRSGRPAMPGRRRSGFPPRGI